jgi:hypothetical protein
LFNGTIADEQEVLTACLAQLHLGERQVVRSLTRSGLQVPGDERLLAYLPPESDGTLRFSRVGIDLGVTQAMLYAGQQFDWNIGSGGFWLFSKLDGEWTQAGRVGSWIS